MPVALAFTVSALLTSTTLAGGPFLDVTFDAARDKAKTDGKVVMVDFYTTWCGPCKQLDRVTWKDERVVKWLQEKTVALKLDAEKETKLAEKYAIQGYPTIIFIRPDGTEIDRMMGYRDPAAFLTEAAGALSGKDAVARAREMAGDKADKDPSARMKIGDALAMKGRHKEALSEYLWCWDHGDQPAFVGVRRSFLLMNIMQLGTDYPAATKALRKRRNALKKELLAGDAEFDTVADYGALNRTLEDQADSLEVFDAMKERGASGRKARELMAPDLLNELIEARRYADVIGSLGNGIVEEVNKGIQRYHDTKKHMAKRDGDTDLVDYMKQAAIAEGAKYYEAAIGMKERAQADAISAAILKLDDSEKTIELLASHATRAGDERAASALKNKKQKSNDD